MRLEYYGGPKLDKQGDDQIKLFILPFLHSSMSQRASHTPLELPLNDEARNNSLEGGRGARGGLRIICDCYVFL